MKYFTLTVILLMTLNLFFLYESEFIELLIRVNSISCIKKSWIFLNEEENSVKFTFSIMITLAQRTASRRRTW